MMSSAAEQQQQQIAQPQPAAPSLFQVINVAVDPTNTTAVVTIGLATPTNSPDVAFHQLKGFDAKKLSLAEASKRGIASPGVQQTGNPYPVDSAGNRITKMSKEASIHSWCIDITTTARMV